MSILSGIKNFIYETLGVDETPPVKSATSANAVSKPIIKTKNVPQNIDTFTIKNKPAIVVPPTNNGQPQRSVGQIRQSIENKCRANNLDFTKLKQRFGYIAEDLKTKFEELPEKRTS